ncbi:MAG: hypothetical protein WAN43_08920 [Rhodomicrobium sp.]
MHIYEAVVEASVKLLAKTDRGDLRDLYKALYAFQRRYDTGYTHFRVIEHLLQARFVYRIAMREHPDYALYKVALDEIANKDEGWVALNPTLKGSKENPCVGYWKDNYLYFDAGDELWKKLVAAKKLTGSDSIPPKNLDIIEVALTVVDYAKNENDNELIDWLYAFLPLDLAYFSQYDPKSLKENSNIIKFRDIAIAKKCYEFEHEYNDGTLGYWADPDAWDYIDPKFHEFLFWWFAPVIERIKPE